MTASSKQARRILSLSTPVYLIKDSLKLFEDYPDQQTLEEGWKTTAETF